MVCQTRCELDVLQRLTAAPDRDNETGRRHMFKLTTAAAEQVLRAAKEGGTEGMSLRLAASQQADGTIDYRMGFDSPTEEDIRFQTEGVDIVMTPEDVPLLDETVMDFVEIEPGKPHFIFLNPKDPSYQPPADG